MTVALTMVVVTPIVSDGGEYNRKEEAVHCARNYNCARV